MGQMCNLTNCVCISVYSRVKNALWIQKAVFHTHCSYLQGEDRTEVGLSSLPPGLQNHQHHNICTSSYTKKYLQRQAGNKTYEPCSWRGREGTTWWRTPHSLFLHAFQNKILNRFYWTFTPPQGWVNESYLTLETLAESLSTCFTFYALAKFGEKKWNSTYKEREKRSLFFSQVKKHFKKGKKSRNKLINKQLIKENH